MEAFCGTLFAIISNLIIDVAKMGIARYNGVCRMTRLDMGMRGVAERWERVKEYLNSGV